MKKLKRCPWCGEAVLQLSRRILKGRYQYHGFICPNCSKKYEVLPIESRSKFLNFFKKIYHIILAFFFPVAILLIAYMLLSKNDSFVFPKFFTEFSDFAIIYLLIVAMLLLLESFLSGIGGKLVRSTGTFEPYYHNYKISENKSQEKECHCIVPFSFDFSVRLSINTRKQGGPIFAKKYFTQDAILLANFKSDDAMLSQNSVPLVFKDFVFDKNTAVCRAGFVLDNRYYAGQLKPGMEFTVCEDEYILASGVITEILDKTEN